jgi:hypothetical protein
LLFEIYLIPDSNLLHYSKFAGTVGLFIFALNIKTKGMTSLMLKIAFFFSALGDFFLAAMKAIYKNFDGSLYGIGLFLLAYIFLILAFQKFGNVWNIKNIWKELIIFIPLLVIVGIFFVTMNQYLGGIMIPISILFAITITYMTWTAITTLTRGWFKKSTATLIGIAAVLIFISDFAVAYEIFLPAFYNPPAWIEALVRGTFTPAWTLLLLVLADVKSGENKEKNW